MSVFIKNSKGNVNSFLSDVCFPMKPRVLSELVLKRMKAGDDLALTQPSLSWYIEVNFAFYSDAY